MRSFDPAEPGSEKTVLTCSCGCGAVTIFDEAEELNDLQKLDLASLEAHVLGKIEVAYSKPRADKRKEWNRFKEHLHNHAKDVDAIDAEFTEIKGSLTHETK